MRKNYLDVGFILMALLAAIMACASVSQALDPEAGKLYNDGLALLRQGKSTEALELFKKSVAIDSSDATVFYATGVAYSKLKKFDNAIESYKKAVLIDIGYSDAHYALGRLYLAKKDESNAFDSFKLAVAADSECLRADHAPAAVGPRLPVGVDGGGFADDGAVPGPARRARGAAPGDLG